jgi:hypothetical protein
MVALIVPTIPTFPAGYIVQQSDLTALSAAAAFLLNKPFTRVVDNTGGVSIPTSFLQISFTAAEIDVDGMWKASNPNILTIQTPGWYKVRYTVAISTPNNSDYNTEVSFTTGPNNPLGSGTNFGSFYASYVTDGAFMHASGSGIIPYYLYSGDQVHLHVISGGDTGGHTMGAPQGTFGSGNAGCQMSLEFVSAV